MPEKEVFHVLRVTQLDAEEINNGICSILRNEIKGSLQTSPFSYLLNFEPEIYALLRLVLWKYSVHDTESSIGQAMLNSKYTNMNGGKLITQKKYAYGMLTVLIYWFKDRQRLVIAMIAKLLEKNEKIHMLPLFEKFISHFITVLNFLSLINFLLFLQSGTSVNLIERLLGLKHVFRGKPSPRYIDYEYMRKELIWRYIMDTVFCILPFVNFRKLFNLAENWFRPSVSPKDSEIIPGNVLECRICSEKATNPYSSECNHVFCYYCIKGNMNADSNFQCPICRIAVQNIKPLVICRSSNKEY